MLLFMHKISPNLSLITPPDRRTFLHFEDFLSTLDFHTIQLEVGDTLVQGESICVSILSGCQDHTQAAVKWNQMVGEWIHIFEI
jgi:hypothetical protein